MTSNQKIANYNTLELLMIYKVYFGYLVICSSNMVVLTLFTKLIHFTYSFINYKRYILVL
jgi:hypothetical protein